MDAFSMLAVPLANTGEPDPSKLIGFFAQEMQLFFQHIQGAVVSYTNTGELPASMFTNKQVKALEKQAGTGEKRKGKTKRKPTAFNLFVKETLADFKERGIKGSPKGADGTGANNSLFKMAVDEWSKLSDAEKAMYHAKYAPIIAAAGPGAHDGEESGEHEEEEEEEEEHELANGYVEALDATNTSPKKKKAKHG